MYGVSTWLIHYVFWGWLWVSIYILTYTVFYYKYFPSIFSEYIHIYRYIYTWNCEKVTLILSHYKLLVMKSIWWKKKINPNAKKKCIWWVWKSWKPLILGQFSHLTDGETETQRGDLTSLRSQANTGRARTNQDQVQSSPSLLFLPTSHSPFQSGLSLHADFSLLHLTSACCNHPHEAQFQRSSQGSLPGCFLWNFSTLFVPLSRHLV